MKHLEAIIRRLAKVLPDWLVSTIAKAFRKTKPSEPVTGDDYIRIQEETYQVHPDPWNSEAGPRHRILHQHYRIVAAILSDSDRAILEVGCGLGALTRLLAKNHEGTMGLDASPTAVSRAQEFGPGIPFEVGDIRTWHHPNHGHIDAVLLMEVLHRFGPHDQNAILRNVHSMLRPGGKVLVNYGHDVYLSGKQSSSYPDIGPTIFSVFKPVQVVTHCAIDWVTSEELANRTYVGVKS